MLHHDMSAMLLTQHLNDLKFKEKEERPPRPRPPSTFCQIYRDRADLGCSLCCNTTAGDFGSASSLTRLLWYRHSVESAEPFTCEMSAAVIVIKAKTAPNDEAVAEIPKSDYEKLSKDKTTAQCPLSI